jgi:hypothetical protein
MTDIKTNNSKTTEWLLFIICIVITAGITLVYTEIHRHNMIAQSSFSYTLNKDFENNIIDTAIAGDIEEGKHILTIHGGRWTERQLTQYLGFFELMEDYIEAGSLNTRDVFDNYSDDLLSAYNHPELKQYIAKLRADTKDNAYYEKFEKLAKDFTAANTIKK